MAHINVLTWCIQAWRTASTGHLSIAKHILLEPTNLQILWKPTRAVADGVLIQTKVL